MLRKMTVPLALSIAQELLTGQFGQQRRDRLRSLTLLNGCSLPETHQTLLKQEINPHSFGENNK